MSDLKRGELVEYEMGGATRRARFVRIEGKSALVRFNSGGDGWQEPSEQTVFVNVAKLRRTK